jgi:hypothetical protein
MDININMSSISRSTSHFFHRFHVIIFVVVVLGALGASIFIIYQNILSTDDAHGYTAQTNNTTFDPVTREKLSQLNAPNSDGANSTRSITIDGRLNPFVE